MSETAKRTMRPLGEDIGTVIACQGPPVCLLDGEDAMIAAQSGCHWCKRITLHEDGSEITKDPIRDRQ